VVNGATGDLFCAATPNPDASQVQSEQTLYSFDHFLNIAQLFGTHLFRKKIFNALESIQQKIYETAP